MPSQFSYISAIAWRSRRILPKLLRYHLDPIAIALCIGQRTIYASV
ncbi:hypothetical protein [Tumidithrix helvetica]